MPTWGEILKELIDFQSKEKKPPFDFVRRKYLRSLQQYTNRNTILYASNWTQPKDVPSQIISIVDEDIQGFMEVVSGLSGSELDIIIHSPGGSAEATEALVIYLRSKFDHIRMIIPYGAMSAATMLACSADEIVMGKHSFIGPIDPQVLVHTRLGLQAIPAQAIIEQFERACEECKADPKNLGVWIPIVEQYGPALLVQCKNAIELSKLLVAEWLEKYMFAKDKQSKEKSNKIANMLANHSFFKSHGRHIGREQAKKDFGLRITNLEDDQDFQDLVLSVFHTTTHTFEGTPAVKIIENHLGRAFVKHSKQLTISVPQPQQTPTPPKGNRP
jgi:hypothetical protein